MSLIQSVATAGQQATGEVRGLVVSSGTNAPIADATVDVSAVVNVSAILPNGAPPSRWKTASGRDGSYEVKGFPSGDYSISATEAAIGEEACLAR